MIAGAALLVLVGLGLFVAGIMTGVTALYWGCVAACVVAAILLVAVRRQLDATPAVPVSEPAPEPVAEGAAETAAPAAGDAAGSPSVTATARRGAAGPRSASSAPGAEASPAAPPGDTADPEVEEVEVTDLLLVVDLQDEVLVVDEHPRYHLESCPWLTGRETIPIPLDEARTDGFTPCALCSPDRTLAERARARKHPGH